MAYLTPTLSPGITPTLSPGIAVAALAAIVSFLSFAPTSSFAQEVRRDAISPAPETNWSGFHFGAFGGWAWGEVDASPLFTNAFGGFLYYPLGGDYGFDSNAAFGGAQAGFDWQWGRAVLGLAADVGYAGFDESAEDMNFLPSPFPDGRAVTTYKGKLFGSMTGRLGASFDRFLLYARGGVAFLDAEASTVDTCAHGPCGLLTIDASGDDLLWGFTVGAGAEVALGEHWAVGAEYRYYDFQDLEVSGVASNLLLYSQDVDFDFHQVRASVNFRW